MYITLTPMRRDETLTLLRKGDCLTINDTTHDFSRLAEGECLTAATLDCPWLISDVARRGGILHLTLILPHGEGASDAVRFPAPLDITGDGPIALPVSPPPSAAQKGDEFEGQGLYP